MLFESIVEYMFFYFQKESPETISVFELTARTTNALEAFNGVLGKTIPKRSHFFRFVHSLLKIEREKAYEVQTLIATGGASAPVKKSSSAVSIF